MSQGGKVRPASDREWACDRGMFQWGCLPQGNCCGEEGAPMGRGGGGPQGKGEGGALGKRGGGGEVVVNMLREERSGLSSRCQTFQICDQQRV